MKQFSQLFKPAAILFGAAVLFSSCSEDMDPNNNVSLDFKGVYGATASTARLANSGLNITEAIIGIEEIELEQDLEDVETAEGEEEVDDLEYDFEGPFVVDLLAGTSSPEIPVATIQEGIYHELEAEISPVLENGASISIKGTYTAADGSEVPVSFTYSDSKEFEVENEAGFEVSAANLNNISVLFDFDVWFGGIDFASATVNDMGEIIIDESTNTALYEAIEVNLEHAAELHEEDDDDDDEHDEEDDEEETED